MLDQKAQAIANKKKINEELEAEASGLMAHGDYILNQVNQVREAQRWMTSKDILNYLNGFFENISHVQNYQFRIMKEKFIKYLWIWK